MPSPQPLTPQLARQVLGYGTRFPDFELELEKPRERVRRFSAWMSTGLWLPRPSRMLFYTHCGLMDGYHRCCAIILSGVTVEVVWASGGTPPRL